MTLQHMSQQAWEKCLFRCNFDAASVKVDDRGSHHVEIMDEVPFVGFLVDVQAEPVLISPNVPTGPHCSMHDTRERRPRIALEHALG